MVGTCNLFQISDTNQSSSYRQGTVDLTLKNSGAVLLWLLGFVLFRDTNTTNVHQMNSYVHVKEVNKVKNNYRSPYVLVSQTRVNDMEFDTLMKFS